MNKQIRDFNRAADLQDGDLFLISQNGLTRSTSVSDLRSVMKGDKGETGEKGEPGIQGNMGEKGEPGPTGEKGSIGTSEVINQNGGGILNIWCGTQEDFDTVIEKDSSTLYFIS